MPEQKTKPTEQNVAAFLDAVPDEGKRRDSYTIVEIMQRVTGEEPKMWGPSMVGFGSYHYTYASGTSGDSFISGFSPRKQNLTLYIQGGFDQYDDLLSRLGKHSTGKACLYVKRLGDIDMSVLEELITRSVEHMSKTH
jgi:hypothetical protein